MGSGSCGLSGDRKTHHKRARRKKNAPSPFGGDSMTCGAVKGLKYGAQLCTYALVYVYKHPQFSPADGSRLALHSDH